MPNTMLAFHDHNKVNLDEAYIAGATNNIIGDWLSTTLAKSVASCVRNRILEWDEVED